MGAGASTSFVLPRFVCPEGFELDSSGTLCRIRCPQGFKLVTSPEVDQCTTLEDNSISFNLRRVPSYPERTSEPASARAERMRVDTLAAGAREKLAAKAQLKLLNAERSQQGIEYTRIQSEYAGFASAAGTTDVIKEVSKSLTPFRPPTSPSDDIERERKAISSLTSMHFLVIQVALFTLIVVLLTYVFLPTSIAHTIAFLVIVCGIAAGFFLRK